jgi:uncharacterized protein YfdQ (DUF2303 family)
MGREMDAIETEDRGVDLEGDEDGFNGNDLQLALDAGRQMADPYDLDAGKVWALRTRHGVSLVDLTGDEFRDRPRRKTGTTSIDDVDSFLAYIDKHGDASFTEVYADTKLHQFVAVLNGHGGADADQPGWCDHRVIHTAEYHPRFEAWKQRDGRWLAQSEMADFIETSMSGVAVPDAATLLEVVSNFQSHTNVSFKSGIQTQSGQKILNYTESMSASAGTSGQIEIPAQLELGLPVFRASTRRDVIAARFQFRVRTGELSMRYVLIDLDDVVASAFKDFTDQVQEWLEERDYEHLLLGRPAR